MSHNQYHSKIECDRTFGTCNMAWMPLRNPNGVRGNAPPTTDHDIIGKISKFYE